MSAQRHRQSALPIAAFLGTLALLGVGTALVVDHLPALADLRPEADAGAGPPDDDHYLANDIGGHVDHHVLYFGTDAIATARLREAEVLFLGNSRLMFALRPEVLRPFFAERQQSYYVLGFGFREADRFPLAILRKFDLRPRVVVVNADGFFGGGQSPWAEQVMLDTPFAARKRQYESEAAHDARRLAHVVFPHWPSLLGLPGLGRTRTFTAYRSRIDGTWHISPWPPATERFTPAPLAGTGIGRAEARDADAFKAEIEARGGRLILTRVPTPVAMPGAGAQEFADRLQVPLVTVDIPGPTSADHSHLDAASAHDWTRAFTAALAPFLDGGEPDRGSDPDR